LLRLVQDDSLVLHLKPLHGIVLGHPVLDTHTGLGSPSSSNPVPWALEDDVEIHTVNTGGRVVPAGTTGKHERLKNATFSCILRIYRSLTEEYFPAAEQLLF